LGNIFYKNKQISGGTDAACDNKFGVKKIAYNVPAVYDGLAARIEKCVAFLGPTNCGGGFAWE
jgi:hypothetical protein